MSENGKALSEESFEFIETPAAEESAPAPNCGVKTTNVSVVSIRDIVVASCCAGAAIGCGDILKILRLTAIA